MSQEDEHARLRAAVGARARAVYRQATTLAAAFASDTGLGATVAGALRVLDAAAEGPLTASQLGTELRLTSGAVTKLLDRLEAAGLVERRRGTVDRRHVFVALTDKARRIGATRLAPIGARIEGATAELTTEELAVVERFLAALADDAG